MDDLAVAAELDSDELPDEYKTCIYRVVQEALHNCARHSRATTVRIRVEQEPDRLLLDHPGRRAGFRCPADQGTGVARNSGARYALGRKLRDSLAAGKRNHALSVELPFEETDLRDSEESRVRVETDSHPVG